ncbi:MAG: transposase [Clostridiales bacterium]|nr:transposase [Clostridiales bacterium]
MGLEITTSIYECSKCDGRPLKEKCIRACGSKKPLEERHKVIYVSKRFARQREDMEAKISSPKGCLLRVNRSIQAESNFAYVKQELDFRRFLLCGNVKIAAEWLLFSLALNILRLHHKIRNGRSGSGLIVPSSFPAGL